MLNNQRVIAPETTYFKLIPSWCQGVTEQLRYGGVLQVVQVSLELEWYFQPLVVAGLLSCLRKP